MKKIFTVLMALGIALCTVANPTFSVAEKLDMSKVKTPRMEKQFTPVEKTSKVLRVDKQDARQAMVEARQAKAVAPMAINGVRQVEAMPVAEKQALPVVNNKQRAAAQATAATDTVEIAATTWEWEYYESDNDWYTRLTDATKTYEIYLDYVSTTQAGTFTEADCIMDYTGMYIYDEEGSRTIVSFTEVDIVVTDDENGLALNAELLGENNTLYLVSALIAPLPEPVGYADLAYTNATLEDGTRSSETFQFWADENGVYTSFLIASDEVVGEYTQDDMYVAYANYIMFVDGTDTTFVDFLGFDMAITKEGQTYNLVADALGSDTIMYHITMSYTKPAPTDTIDIVATNMVVDEFEYYGQLWCTVSASNDDYTVTLDMANGLPLGELTSADFNVEWSSVYRIADSTEIVFDDILSATVTEVDGQRAIKAQALGVDTILYNLDLSYVLPEAKDTVAIEFTTPASSEYYDSYGDYSIYNENEEYIVVLDIFAEKNALEGEYEGEDFDYYYTKVGLIVDGDTTAVEVALAKATVTKVSEELAHIDAELLCENEVLYLVSTDVTMSKLGLQYDMTEGEVNREYNLKDELTFNTDYVADYGELYVDVMAGDMSDLMSLLFFVNDTVEGLVLPEGTYPISDTYAEGTVLASTGYDEDYGAMPSNYCTLVEDGGTLYLNECFFMVGGSVVVEHVDGHLKITIDAVNSYDVPAHIVYEATPEPDYMLLEDKITNLVIDLESMAIIGGPSTMWQVEVYLGLAEDDNMDGQWSLSPESSVTIMGSDARFIDGYVYDIDQNAPAAKAVLHVEDSGFFYEIKLDMTYTPTEAIVVVIEDATVAVNESEPFPGATMKEYSLTMTANWTYAEDGVTYPVLVEVPVYDPNATEPLERLCTVTIGGNGDTDPWLGFGEGTLTITIVDGVVTAKGIVVNPYTKVAFDVTVSGKLPQGPGTGLDNVQVEVKTVKMIKNGQLIINRGGKAYNAIGVQVK